MAQTNPGPDRWRGKSTLDGVGRHRVAVVGWTDDADASVKSGRHKWASRTDGHLDPVAGERSHVLRVERD